MCSVLFLLEEKLSSFSKAQIIGTMTQERDTVTSERTFPVTLCSHLLL